MTSRVLGVARATHACAARAPFCYDSSMPKLDATSASFALILTTVASLGTVFFWTIGAVLLLTGNGGLINDMVLDAPARTLFLAYPVVVALALVSAGVLFMVRRTAEAVAFAGLPLAALVVYYLVATRSIL